MDKLIEHEVRRRAQDACEYCQMPQRFYRQRFPIDHVVARQHGGTSTLDNLAMCCAPCNRYKGPNVAGVDPETHTITRLFNPREDDWNDHFFWNGPLLTGRTPIGRATVLVLNVNHADYVAVRASLIAEGIFPRDPDAGP